MCGFQAVTWNWNANDLFACILATTGTTWTLIGVVIAIGIGLMISVSSSGTKESIEIDRK